MFGKIAGLADGAVAGASQIKQGFRMGRYIDKGLKVPKSVANDAAQKQGMFSKALGKAQESTLGSKLTANTGYKFKTEKIDYDMLESVEQIKMAHKTKINEINETLGGLDGSDLKNATKKRDHLLDKTKRMDEMLNTGEYQREYSMGEYAADYFGDEEYGGFRKKAAIGAGIGLGVGMVGARYATGGNLTRNGDGDRDIVGIPFI